MKNILFLLMILFFCGCQSNSDTVSEKNCKKKIYNEFGEDIKILKQIVTDVDDVKYDDKYDSFKTQYLVDIYIQKNETYHYCHCKLDKEVKVVHYHSGELSKEEIPF